MLEAIKLLEYSLLLTFSELSLQFHLVNIDNTKPVIISLLNKNKIGQSYSLKHEKMVMINSTRNGKYLYL